MDYSTFLIKMICEVLCLESNERLSEKDKADFIDSMKGLYFLSIQLRKKGVFYDYLLTSFHLEMQVMKNMFTDYEELENLFIKLLEGSKKDRQLVWVSLAI